MAVENRAPTVSRDTLQAESTFAPPVTDARAKPWPDTNAGQATRMSRPIIWMHAANPQLTIGTQPGASALAIGSEVEVCAARFAATGEKTSIDLRFLKAMPEERETLASLLGTGEVAVVVESIGRTEIRETAVPCVWWIRHQNSEGETIGELIEIAEIPALVVGDREAVARGLVGLRAALSFHVPGQPMAPPFPKARYAI